MTVVELEAALADARKKEAQQPAPVVVPAAPQTPKRGVAIAFRDWIDGNKTYIMLAATILYTVGISYGWWPHNYIADSLFGGGTLAAARSAFQKLIDATNIQTALIVAPKTTVYETPGTTPTIARTTTSTTVPEPAKL